MISKTKLGQQPISSTSWFFDRRRPRNALRLVVLLRQNQQFGLTEDVTGDWQANMMVDYAKRDLHWRDQINQAFKEMFDGFSNDDYT